MTHVTHVSACCAIPSRLRFNVGAPGLCLTAHSTVVAGQRIRDAPHLWQGLVGRSAGDRPRFQSSLALIPVSCCCYPAAGLVPSASPSFLATPLCAGPDRGRLGAECATTQALSDVTYVAVRAVASRRSCRTGRG